MVRWSAHAALMWPVIALPAMALPAAAQPVWTHFARTPQRVCVAAPPVPSITEPKWVAAFDQFGAPILFFGQGGVVADESQVYAIGRYSATGLVATIDRATGRVVRTSPIPLPVFESWSTPAIDMGNGTVIAGTGKVLTAISRSTGAQVWQRPLDREIVNASPIVTTDRHPADRAFITDFDGFGNTGKLYCINVDPFNAPSNPYQPGQIVWSVTLGGTVGNTPAYAGGMVFVASVSDTSGASPGMIYAFPAGATTPPAPAWTFVNPVSSGFFGGVAVTTDAGGVPKSLFAASYAFVGGMNAANMVKVNAQTGALVWSTPSNRTSATPIPLSNGRIVLSGGVALPVPGTEFTVVPSVSLYQDAGAGATRLWDTALDTWIDLDGDGKLNVGEFLMVGGFTHEPVVIDDPSGPPLLVSGAISASPMLSAACSDLYLIDLSRAPRDTGFIRQHRSDTGGTPALVDGWLYTIGEGGVYAFPPQPCFANCDGSMEGSLATLNFLDFLCFQNRFAAGDPTADCDHSGGLTIADFLCFQNSFALGCR